MPTRACETAEFFIQVEVDGELDAIAGQALAQHVAECQCCARLRSEYQHVAALVREVGATARRAPGRRKPVQVARRTRAHSGLAAVLLLGSVLLLILARPSTRPSLARVAEQVLAIDEESIIVARPSRSDAVQIVWIYQLPPPKGSL
ncbi:MAG: hypothetical protein ACKVX7_16210 [Planctomycetota bacterium]